MGLVMANLLYQNQYPLKNEVIVGIKPMFQFLPKAGVIVPSKDSLVQRPLYLLQ